MELEIVVQRFKVPAVCVWLPSRVTQVPFHQEFDFIAHPMVGGYLIDEPFSVVWVAHHQQNQGVLSSAGQYWPVL